MGLATLHRKSKLATETYVTIGRKNYHNFHCMPTLSTNPPLSKLLNTNLKIPDPFIRNAEVYFANGSPMDIINDAGSGFIAYNR